MYHPREVIQTPSGSEPHAHEGFGGQAFSNSRGANDAIAQRAYEIYVRSGREPGQCQKHWQQAERELAEERQAAFDEQDTVYQESPTPAHEEMRAQEERSSNLRSWWRGSRHIGKRLVNIQRQDGRGDLG